MAEPACIGKRRRGRSSLPRTRRRRRIMLAAFSVAPGGGENSDASVPDAVAAAVEIVRRSGQSHRTDSMFHTTEGERDEVFSVINHSTEAVGECGTRVSLVVKADIRPGYTGEIDGKIERLEKAIDSRSES